MINVPYNIGLLIVTALIAVIAGAIAVMNLIVFIDEIKIRKKEKENNNTEENNNEEQPFNLKKVLLTFVLSLIVFVVALVTNCSYLHNTKEKIMNLVSTLELQEIHKNDDTGIVQGYFSDEENNVYSIDISNMPIEIETNINIENYQKIIEGDTVKILSPYTRDSLNYAHKKDYIFIFNPVYGEFFSVLMAIVLVMILLISILAISLIIDVLSSSDYSILERVLDRRCCYVIGIILSLFVIGCGIYGYHYNKEQIAQNIEEIKNMDIVLKDNSDIYAVDSEGILYMFDEAEISKNYKYSSEVMEFLKLNEDLYIPFQNLD